MTKVFSKSNPTADGATFTPLPSNAHHYIYHPLMSADKLFLYALIIDYYNEQQGYAYPSLLTLEMTYGKHRDTCRRHLDDLKAVDLIDFPPKTAAYVPLVPLGKTEFMARWPDAEAAYKRAVSKRDKQRSSAKERARKWREELETDVSTPNG